MSLREKIITHALLGTGKKPVNIADFPSAFGPVLERVKGEDEETRFMQSAALTLNYVRAGVKPLRPELTVNEAPEEEKPYCSAEAMAVLSELLSCKYPNLTWFWCKRCHDKGQIVGPELLPELFQWGVSTRKQWAALFSAVIGKRGIWLSQFSDEWKFVNAQATETDWDTAGLPQRIQLLRELRSSNPSDARYKIELVWKEENAATRLELLETLTTGISKDDEPFLLQTLTDKSVKVKELSWQLLKMIPDSEIIMQYRQILKDSFAVSTNKVLGLISKTNIEVKLKLTGNEILKTGIQSLSSDKKISDDNFILMQLISEVPPDFWTEHFSVSPEEVAKMFASRDELKIFQQSFIQAVIKFRSKLWAKLVAGNFGAGVVDLLPFLEGADKIRYAEFLLKGQSALSDIVSGLRDEQNLTEWNYNFSRQLISTMAQDPYAYANIFESIAVYLPVAILNDLDKFFPSEEWKRNYWQKTTAQIREYIRLKEKIKAIF